MKDKISSDAWHIPTLSVIDEMEKCPPAQYTIFNENYVYRPVTELQELCQAMKNEQGNMAPKELVAFKPERLALHELIVYLITTYQIENDEELVRQVDKYRTLLFPYLRNEFEKIEQERLDIEKKITEIIQSDYRLEHEYKEEVTKINAHISNSTSILDIDSERKNKIIIAIATDRIYSKNASERIRKIIDFHLNDNDLFNELDKKRINYAPNLEERATFIVAGGQASGKGSAVNMIKSMVEGLNINWQDIVKINTDSYKPLLLKPGAVPPKFYSQLAQEEASLIHAKIHHRINHMLENGKALHVFIDQVFLGKDKLETAVKGNGSAYVFIVSTRVEDAVERSFERGNQLSIKGRFEDTSGILRCHKNMARQIPDVLKGFIGEKIFIQLIDNNVAFSETPIAVLNIAMEEGEIAIIDKDRLQEFIKKCTINVKASSKREVYDDSLFIGIEQYLEPIYSAKKANNELTNSQNNFQN